MVSKRGFTLSTRESLYDGPTGEIHLLESAPIQGRKTELRQLLKLLNMAKSGQPKAALITGDAGIGKSALVNAFIEVVREGVYCRILNLGRLDAATPEDLYVAFMDALRKEADEILNDALTAVNDITRELDLKWERQDLVRAIALVKLQETVGSRGVVSREQLVKDIRNQVPTVKKLKFSVNDSIEKLADLIVNPWVMVATSILNPMHPALQDALALADRLKTGEKATVPGADVSSAPLAIAEEEDDSPHPAETIIHVQADTTTPGTQLARIDGAPPAEEASRYPSAITPSYPLGGLRIETATRPIRNPLVQHLMNVFNHVNAAIETLDSGMLVVIDEWDRVQNLPEREAMKAFLEELAYQMGERKDFHFLTLVTARNEGESYTLGGSLYNQFRTKLLLEPLSETLCTKLTRQSMQQVNATLDESVNRRIYALSKGNAYWHLKITNYLAERVESNRLRYVDGEFFDRLGIESLHSVLELGYTRLKLAFLSDEDALHKVVAALLKQFGERVFTANMAVKEISASQGFAEAYVFEVLRALYRHDFIRLAREGKGDPAYTLQSRFAAEFLRGKTRAIETDISTDEKLMYLKKIIPLSVKTGELDREKTMEVLALSDAMGNREIVGFLEDVFLDALKDDKPVVRVTALNNIAIIDSERARDALFRALSDRDSMVREYAARNLALLSKKQPDPALSQRIVDALLKAIDDESEAVRGQAYSTLSKYRQHRDLTYVFVKGLSDASDSVRLTSVECLAETESDSPFVYNSLLDAMDDPVPEVRRHACLGIQKYHRTETIDAIVRMLETDTEHGIRALAADSLSMMEHEKAFKALVSALQNEASEDVRLAAVRALGKRRGWQVEEVLINSLASIEIDENPVFAWAAIRSLGQVGGTDRSLGLLSDLGSRTTNSILASAIEHAAGKIHARVNELRQLERQLEEATPLTMAIPGEYREEVVVVEEDPLDLGRLDEREPPILTDSGPMKEEAAGFFKATEFARDHESVSWSETFTSLEVTVEAESPAEAEADEPEPFEPSESEPDPDTEIATDPMDPGEETATEEHGYDAPEESTEASDEDSDENTAESSEETETLAAPHTVSLPFEDLSRSRS